VEGYQQIAHLHQKTPTPDVGGENDFYVLPFAHRARPKHCAFQSRIKPAFQRSRRVGGIDAPTAGLGRDPVM
jgi:hypothetical protein